MLRLGAQIAMLTWAWWKLHRLGRELAEVGGDVLGSTVEEGDDFVSEVVGSDEKDVEGFVRVLLRSVSKTSEGKNKENEKFHGVGDPGSVVNFVDAKVWDSL